MKYLLAFAALFAFLAPAQAATEDLGQFTVSWTPPAWMADGSSPARIAGYRIYWGSSPGVYPSSQLVLDSAATSATVKGVPLGMVYVVVTALGLESEVSVEVSKDIVAPAPGVWRTPATGTYTLYTAANGKLTQIIAGRKATPNALCDGTAAPIASGTSTYLPLAGAAPSEFTLCKKAAQ